MNKILKKLYENRAQAVEMASRYTAMIKEFEKVCLHNWVYEGHNESLYICTECGARKYI